MINRFIRVEELEFLAGDFYEDVSIGEILREIRPPPWTIVSPERYRQIFKITEVMRVACEVAQKKRIEGPWSAFLQKISDQEEKR
jgi:hypothetical protein